MSFAGRIDMFVNGVDLEDNEQCQNGLIGSRDIILSHEPGVVFIPRRIAF